MRTRACPIVRTVVCDDTGSESWCLDELRLGCSVHGRWFQVKSSLLVGFRRGHVALVAVNNGRFSFDTMRSFWWPNTVEVNIVVGGWVFALSCVWVLLAFGLQRSWPVIFPFVLIILARRFPSGAWRFRTVKNIRLNLALCVQR